MRSVVPDAKLVYVVRDPLERIAAHWVHNYAKRREKGDLAATLAHPSASYVVRSQYHMQLQQFLAHYPLEQILVIEQEELRSAPHETLRRLFEFAGVDPGFTHPHFGAQRHETSRKTRASRLAVRLERLSGSAPGPGGAQEPLAGDRRAGEPPRPDRAAGRPRRRWGPRRCGPCARTPSGCAS